MSPLSTLLYLALLIALPFLIVMILIYIWFIHFYQEEQFCEPTRIVGLQKKIHEDSSSDALDLVCSGWILVFGSNSQFIVSSDCFKNVSDTASTKANYFCTSGSLYWIQKRNLHSIKAIEDFGNVSHVAVTPAFPDCLTKQNYSIRGDFTTAFVIAGWDISSRFSSLPYRIVDQDQKEPCHSIDGGAILNTSNIITSLQRKNCGERGSVDIADSYPNLRILR